MNAISTAADNGDIVVRPLTVADLSGCLALSRTANWNQNAADWTLMLRAGQGWGIELPDPDAGDAPVLAGSIIALPFDQGTASDFAWLSMVLVLPRFGGRGLATRLLEVAVGWLRERKLPAVLDATPQGLPVYGRIGMQPHWMFRRYRREAVDRRPGSADELAAAQPASPRSRPLADGDWPAILAADRIAFGARREAILRDLAARQPGLARVLTDDQGLRGFVFGRDGREATQVGPLWARDGEAAQCLLDEALGQLPGPVYLDLADAWRDLLLPRVAAAGFAEQRPFTRMTLDTDRPPGDPARLVLMAGPELG